MTDAELETLTDTVLSLFGIRLSEQDRLEVLRNMGTLRHHAGIVMREALPNQIEIAPEFRA